MRLLQAMAGSSMGGAENFFMRLAPALAPYITQRLLIRDQSERLNALERQEVSVTPVPFGGGLDFKSRIQFFKEIKQFSPDIVLTWMSRATGFCPSQSMLRKRLNPFLHLGRLGGFYDLKYYKNCDALIGNTKGVVDYIIQKGWPSSKVFYLPNFAEIPENVSACDRKIHDTPETAPLILSVGRLQVMNMIDFLKRCENEVTIQVVLNESPGELEELLRRFHAEHGETAQGFASLLQTRLEALAKTRFPQLEPKFVSPKAARHFISNQFQKLDLLLPQAKEEPSKMTLFLRNKKNHKDIRRIILDLAPLLEKSKGQKVVHQFEVAISALPGGERCTFDGHPSAGHKLLTRLFEKYIEKGPDGTFRLKESE